VAVVFGLMTLMRMLFSGRIKGISKEFYPILIIWVTFFLAHRVAVIDSVRHSQTGGRAALG
jgi:hypothetical protein